MTRSAFLFSGLALVFVQSAPAQVALEWARKYNGPGNDSDAALAIALDSVGNIFVTGGSENARGYLDITTLKYSSSGDQLWVIRFNEVQNADMIGFNLAVDTAGNVYVAGGVTMKMNPNGDTTWIKRISGTFSGMRFVNTDRLGSAIATGVRINDYQTKKYSPSGDEQWARYLSGPEFSTDYTYDQHLDKQGNVIVTGRIASREDTVTGYTDYTIGTAKYTPNGDTVWIRYYEGPTFYDAGYDITSDDSGNVYVTGESDDSTGTPDLILLKYSPSGETQWITRYRRTSIGDVGNDVAVDKSGNVYVAGVTGTSNYMLVKFNVQGIVQWSRIYSQYAFAIPLPKLALDSAGYVYVSGHQRRDPWSDMRIAKYDADGNQLWLVDYPQNGIGYNEPNDMKLDRQGNIYVTGSGRNDYLTLKYRQTPTGVAQEPVQPLEFSLHQNYPNPFNPRTEIRYRYRKSVA